MKLILILLMVRCLVSEAFLFGGGPEWDDLSVTWGPNPLSSGYFDKLPRTNVEAIRRGWVLEKNCSQGVMGNRYILNGDKSVILIYAERDGFIAGIASAFPKNLPFNYPSPEQAAYFKDEGDQYTINAYFDSQYPTDACKPYTPSEFHRRRIYDLVF